MIKKIIICSLLLLSSLVLADASLKFENAEVKITNIDMESKTIDFVENNVKTKTLTLFESVLIRGYHTSANNTIKLDELELNKKYHIRIAYNDYKDENKKQVSKTYVTFIGTVPYDTLY
ncbi:MAG: hypothetical protein AB8B80_06395 [Marinicellaceae bacterium]